MTTALQSASSSTPHTLSNAELGAIATANNARLASEGKAPSAGAVAIEKGGGNASNAGYTTSSPGYVPAGVAISPDSLKTIPSVTLPDAPALSDPGNILAGNNTGLANSPLLQSLGYSSDGQGGFKYTPPATTETQKPTTDSGFEDIFKQYIGTQTPPPSTAAEYQKEYDTSGIQDKQQAVNNYTTQLNSIVAKAQADTLALTGKGEGIPQGVINNQTAAINRNAAIQALPIQAQLASAQNNLKLAQDHLDTYFKLKSEDMTAQYTYQTNLINAVYKFADDEEQRQLDAKKDATDKAFTVQQNNQSLIQSAASTALSTGQSNLIPQLTSLNPNSPTFTADLGKIQAQIVDPSVALDLENKQLSNQKLRYDLNHPSSGSTGTEAERAAAAVAQFSSAFVPGATLDGVPTLDSDGYATPEAWKAAIKDAPAEGLSREDFIKQFGNLILNQGGTVSPKYGITPAELKLITGSLE